MTSQTETHLETTARAADSGANATKFFQSKAAAAGKADSARVDDVARAALKALHGVIRDKAVTYAEYDALKSWLISVGEDGEWPLFLDVFLEHVVEDVAHADRAGTKGTIEGPYYVPHSPLLASSDTLPMRDDEPGTKMSLKGQVRNVSGAALGGAIIDIWQADDLGFYSQFAPGLPEWNLRGRVVADMDGRFEITTVKPAPYQIPTDGSTGTLIAAANWHAWRPAHLHVKVIAEGHETITSQLYFDGGEYLDTDIADAVKPELVLEVTSKDHELESASYDFVLDQV